MGEMNTTSWEKTAEERNTCTKKIYSGAKQLEAERESDMERERGRETHRETARQRETESDRKRQRVTEKETKRERDRERVCVCARKSALSYASMQACKC